MKCHNCKAEIVAHPNYPEVRVWHDLGSEPLRVHKCPPKDKVIQYGKWRGFTFNEAADISDHVNKTHQVYLAKLRAMFISPYK